MNLRGRDPNKALYKGMWHGVLVDVKMLNAKVSDLERWRTEVRALSVLRHPNIVSLLGFVVDPPTFCLVLEHVDWWSVQEAIVEPTPSGFFWAAAKGTTMAMTYLHRKDVLHLNLRTSNILISGNIHVKLANFGMSEELFPESSNVLARSFPFR